MQESDDLFDELFGEKSDVPIVPHRLRLEDAASSCGASSSGSTQQLQRPRREDGPCPGCGRIYLIGTDFSDPTTTVKWGGKGW